ncbi:SCO4402 family protein [Pseudomonas orientalis]|uniref:SCO4402 family protein n=1 Tax=Pseudomonas orientalis TaxID=76758 RepID=UPI000F04F301
MEKLELSELKFPSMREELISYLSGLSDLDYQYQAWVERSSPSLDYDEFNYTVHFLYDDTSLAENASDWIGLVLRDEKEVRSIENLVSALNVIFDKYGTELSDREYLEKNEWLWVVNASKDALSILLSK